MKRCPPPGDWAELSIATPRHQSRAESVELAQTIRALLAKLPPRQRQAVELVYFSGLHPCEAARQLGCSTRAFKVRLSSARQTLRKLVRVEP